MTAVVEEVGPWSSACGYSIWLSVVIYIAPPGDAGRQVSSKERSDCVKANERRKIMSSKKSSKAVAQRFAFQYAVKFLCTSNIPGTSQTTTSLLPGSYATVVNIHNPNAKTAGFRMKLAAATSTQIDPPQITDFIKEALKPDQATKVDCSRIRDFGIQPIHGFEGFLVIESTLSLDVVAVYTAAGNSGQGVVSTNVEYIRERKLT